MIAGVYWPEEAAREKEGEHEIRMSTRLNSKRGRKEEEAEEEMSAEKY